MKFKIQSAYPYLALITLWIIFSFPSLFQGKIPLSTDITMGMYYPWLDSGKVPVKNPILTDTISQFWIWRQWAIDNLMQGHISLWNPYSLAGSIQSPWFHTLLFSPLNIFYFLLPKFQAISQIILSQLLFGLLFAYLFFYKISKSKLAAFFGAITFSFSSYFIGWLTWGSISWTLALLPLSLYLIDEFFDQYKVKYLFLFYISQLFALLGGHPQTYMYYLIVVIGFGIYKYISTKSKIQTTQISTAFIFSCLSAAFVIFPSIEIIKDSIRSQDQFIKSSNYGFVPIKDLLTSAITPGFYGNPATNNYWGGIPNYQEKLFWFGIIPFSLALLWILNFLKNKHKSKFEYFLVIILLLGLTLSLKYPFGFLIYWLKIPLLSSSPAGRGLILSIFSLISMAVIAFKNLLEGHYQGYKTSLIIVGAMILSLYLELFILQRLSIPSFQIKIAFRNLTLSAFIFILYISISIIAFRKYYKLFFLIPFLCFLDLLYFANKYTPFNSSSSYFPDNQLLESLKPKSSQEFYRIEREKSELLPPNMWQAYSLHSTQGYDPMTPQKYVKYLISRDLIKSPTRYIEWQNIDLPKLQNLGIKYYLTLKRDRNNHVSKNGVIDPKIDQKIWRVATESGSVAVLLNKNYQAPYFLENNEKLILINKTDDSWEFESDSIIPNNLVIIENNHPSWHAYIDGQNTSISDYQDTFMQIKVPSGKHKIFVYFEDRYFKTGLYVSIISITIFLIYYQCLVNYLKKK